ncbi:hypothetical protein CYMTET_9514 [Cymbomonas tetramitiformis]|uniref:Uncharacterized protein n=1 Tax=Cymbomonas tetramitiformis TaxID=36881 RepID=A0AAE0GRH9_9CHLO|nr:hypothetical protein CYMTET_9514 [Cymbomonas tetramitiformis]
MEVYGALGPGPDEFLRKTQRRLREWRRHGGGMAERQRRWMTIGDPNLDRGEGARREEMGRLALLDEAWGRD